MEEILHKILELGHEFFKIELSKAHSDEIIAKKGKSANETILFQKMGKFYNQQKMFDKPDGLVVVTTHRFLFLSKQEKFWIKTEFLSFPFDAMRDVQQAKIWLAIPAIKFTSQGLPFIFTFLNSKEIPEMIRVIKRQ